MNDLPNPGDREVQWMESMDTVGFFLPRKSEKTSIETGGTEASSMKKKGTPLVS